MRSRCLCSVLVIVSFVAGGTFMIPGKQCRRNLQAQAGITHGEYDAMMKYVKVLQRIDLLRPEEEIFLASEIKKGALIVGSFVDLEKTLGRPPSEAEWVERTGSKSIDDIHVQLESAAQSKRTMVNAHIRLVVSLCRSYRYTSGVPMSLQDLVQEGTCGLHKAVEKFDPSRGCKFSTYAAHWIKASIMDAIHYHSRTVRLPTHVYSRMSKIRRASEQYVAEHGRAPDFSELSELTGQSPQKAEFYSKVMEGTSVQLVGDDEPASLVAAAAPPHPRHGGRGSDGAEAAGASSRGGEEGGSAEARLQAGVARLLAEAALTPRQADLLRLRFGLGGGRARSLGEIGDAYGIGLAAAARLEARALRKLRDRRPAGRDRRLRQVEDELFLL